MSLRNLTKPKTFDANSPAAMTRAIGAASSATDKPRSRFKDAAPRDRIAISVRNVPGLRNREDDFEVRAWKDSSVSGGIAVRVNCITLSAGAWLSSTGAGAIREYVAAHNALSLGKSNEEIGKAVADIVAQYRNATDRNAALAKLGESLGSVNEKFVTHLHGAVKATVAAAQALLAPLPSGV